MSNGKSNSSRREFLKASTGVMAAAVLGGGASSTISASSQAAEYAPGMTGGPIGFEGAERFQYNSGMSEGRAIDGIKALKAAGKAPKKLTVLLLDGTIDQIRKPFRDGAMSPLDVWMRETGIEIEMIGGTPDDIFKKVMQDVTTGDGAFDIYTGPWNSTGDLVASGGAIDCSDFVKKYKPDWQDPERGSVQRAHRAATVLCRQQTDTAEDLPQGYVAVSLVNRLILRHSPFGSVYC